MAFNTGNPLGSKDVKDLFDNAENLDSALNSVADTWTDRLGVVRTTVDKALRDIGFEVLGDYAGSIQITSFTQVVRESGEFYRLKASETLPYTTTGTWVGDDENRFVSVGDAVLRGDLITAGGASLVGNAAITFDNVASMVAATWLTVGQKVRTLGYYTVGDGGGNDYEIVAAATGTDDGGSFIDLSGSGLQAKGLFNGGMASSKQFGTNNLVGDRDKLQSLINNPSIKKILVEDYSPSGGECYVDRSDVEFDFLYKTIDMTNIGAPVLVLGQKANGTPSDAVIINVEVNNVVSSGNKTAGSRIVRFRKASTCTLRNWRASGCDTPFDGDGTPGGAYESLACEFYNMDLRGNTVGFLDTNGSFQGSTFFGGRIESNDEEGVYTKTPNINFVGTIIEGNGKTNTTRHEIRADGGGSLNLTNCYFEVASANTAPSVILVEPASAKRINIVNGDIYGNNSINPRRVVSGSNWVTGSLVVSGGNINDCNGYVTRAGSPGNWVAFLSAWSNVPLENASTQINGATYYQDDRVLGRVGEKATYSGRVQAENTLVTQAGSGSYIKQFSRFLGTVTTGGVGVWTVVASLTDIGASDSTALVVELTFGARQGDFRFKDAITINGTSTVTFISQIYGNWASSTYRINAGNLEVDNLPASSRDWAVGITTQKTSTA